MNGRIERAADLELLLEQYSEANYSALVLSIEAVREEERERKRRPNLRWAGVLLANLVYWVYLWVRP